MKKRIVLKVGTHILSDGLNLSHERIEALVKFISELMDVYEVILVSSGAVAAGYSKIQLDKSFIPNRQALAAIGQPYLMGIYNDYLENYSKVAAQILLTAEDLDSRKRTNHARNAIDTLLKNKISLPIINENDTTATEELVFGDNDQLSAHVTYFFNASLLVILSDIDGYYTKDPKKYNDAILRKNVDSITDIDLNVNSQGGSLFATGGIVTKLKAAKFLLNNNLSMFLTNGFDLSDAKSFLFKNIHLGGTLFSSNKKA